MFEGAETTNCECESKKKTENSLKNKFMFPKI